MSADEIVDVVDEDDRVVAQATRAQIRRDNLRHRCAYILVFNSHGQLFVHQRTMQKDVFPGYWDVAIGGVLGAGEGYDAGAQRELHEELGLQAVRLRRLFPMQYEDGANRVQGMVFSCTADAVPHLQESEIARGEWMDLDMLLERTEREQFCPDGLEVLRLYLSKLEAARQRQ